MKKKAMIMAVASLGSMALIGTGFAGWVISANTTANASGVMVAYGVKDQRLNAVKGTWMNGAAEAAADKGSIIFGKPAETAVTGAWLTCEEDVEVQRLSDTYVFEVSTVDTGNTGKFTVAKDETTPFVVTDKNDAWANATTNNLVKAEPTISFDKPDRTYDLAGGKATVKMTITFDWGTTFGSDNPYNHYNKTTNPSKELMDQALANLEKVKALNEIAFTVNLSIKAVA